MLQPQRGRFKRARIRRILFITGSCCSVAIILLIAFLRLRFGESLFGNHIISPIPGVLGTQNKWFLSFSGPKEELKDALNKSGIAFSQIYAASNSAYIVTHNEGGEIIFTSQKDIKLQVATLQLILSRLTIEGKTFARLDLRYDKPVILLK